MEVVRALDAGPWKDFVDHHPQGSVFHTPEMFQVFARAKGHQPELWAVTGSGEVLALLLPVRITLSPLWGALTTRVVCYGGLLHNPDSDGALAVKQLLKEYVSTTNRMVLFSELRNLHDQSQMLSVYRDCGFAYEKHLNYLIDLTGSSQEVLQRIGSRTRKNIRRGLRRGNVMVDEVRDQAGVVTCYGLIQRSYQHAHVPLADWSLFEAAFASLTPLGMLRFYLARVGDVPVAASAELFYKETIYGWYSGIERAFGEHTPGELLMWHVLRWGADNGYGVYDFGGAGKPGEAYGVRDFKAKFGGQLVEYGRFSIAHAPIRVKLSKLAYLIYQKVPWFWSDQGPVPGRARS